MLCCLFFRFTCFARSLTLFRTGMKLLYVSQITNEVTGEHSSIMIKSLVNQTKFKSTWLPSFLTDARRRFISLLSGPFKVRSILLFALSSCRHLINFLI